jgi:putative endonuclease
MMRSGRSFIAIARVKVYACKNKIICRSGGTCLRQAGGRRVRPALPARQAQNRISQGVKIIQMYTVYILRSLSKSFQYVGMTNNLERRLQEHNSGYSLATKSYIPFKLVYTEILPDRKSARVREKYFKSGAGREYIKGLCL